MTSREHARRLMLILLSSEGRPGAEAPDAETAERDEERTSHDDDECAEGDSRRFELVEAFTWS
jgi:hypothetical protein